MNSKFLKNVLIFLISLTMLGCVTAEEREQNRLNDQRAAKVVEQNIPNMISALKTACLSVLEGAPVEDIVTMMEDNDYEIAQSNMMLMTQRPDLMNNFRDGVQLRFNTTYVDNDSCVVYGITPDNISLSDKSIKALKKIALNDVRSVGESFAQVAGEKLRKGARHDFVIGSAYYPDYSFHVAEPAQASSLVLVARKYKR